jgi:hypothetical protein
VNQKIHPYSEKWKPEGQAKVAEGFSLPLWKPEGFRYINQTSYECFVDLKGNLKLVGWAPCPAVFILTPSSEFISDEKTLLFSTFP